MWCVVDVLSKRHLRLCARVSGVLPPRDLGSREQCVYVRADTRADTRADDGTDISSNVGAYTDADSGTNECTYTSSKTGTYFGTGGDRVPFGSAKNQR